MGAELHSGQSEPNDPISDQHNRLSKNFRASGINDSLIIEGVLPYSISSIEDENRRLMEQYTHGNHPIDTGTLEQFTNLLNEGGTVTPARRQRWDVETAYSQAYATVQSQGRITLDDLLGIHATVSSNIPGLKPEQKGRISYLAKTFIGAPWEITPFTPPSEINVELDNYITSYNDYLNPPEATQSASEVVNNAALALVDFMAIHPFADGNGRLGRILADTLLEKGDLYNMPKWLPEGIKGLDSRKTFFYMVELARRTGSIALIANFITTVQIECLTKEIESIDEDTNHTVEKGERRLELEDKIQALREYEVKLREEIAASGLPDL